MRQGSLRAWRSYHFSKTISTAMACLWHGMRMGGTGKHETDGQRRRSGQSRAIVDIVPLVGRAASRRFSFLLSSVVRRCHEILGVRYAAVSAPEDRRFTPRKDRKSG